MIILFVLQHTSIMNEYTSLKTYVELFIVRINLCIKIF